MKRRSGPTGWTRFAKPHSAMLVASVVLAVLAAALALVPFWVMVLVTDSLVTGSATTADLGRLAVVVAAGVLAHYLAYGFSSWLSHVAAYRVLADMRMDAARKLGRLSLGQVTGRRSGSVKAILVDDIERMEVFLAHGLPDAVAAAVVWTSMVVWMFAVDWRLAIAAVIVVPIAFYAMGLAIKGNQDYTVHYAQATATMNSAITETIVGLPVISSFVSPSRRLDRVHEAIRAQANISQELGVSYFTKASAFYVLIAANAVTVLPTAAWLAATGRISAWNVVFFAIISLGVNASLVKLFMLASQLMILIRSGKTIDELLAEPDQPDTHQDATLADTRIVFDDVTFSYDGEVPVLHNVSFAVEPGTVTALVGPSGSGKSTLARLLLRAWDAPGISIGGVSVQELSVAQLNRTVVSVAQDSFLFSGTIAENIAMGRQGATAEQVRAAAEAARVTEFTDQLPDGLETRIAERGASLSGGQAQRISIARTLVADPPILVLDEATAHSDPDNEALIQDALSAAMAGRTLLVIAHRLPTVQNADQIVVLDQGTVAGVGRHDDLLTSCPRYAQLWRDWDDLTEAPDLPEGALA